MNLQFKRSTLTIFLLRIVWPSIEDILKAISQIRNGGNTCFCSAKGIPNEGHENLHQATKITDEKETNEGHMVMGNGTGLFYNQYSPHLGDVLKDSSSNTIMNAQGLNDLM